MVIDGSIEAFLGRIVTPATMWPNSVEFGQGYMHIASARCLYYYQSSYDFVVNT